MKKARSKTLTAKQRAELKALAQLADRDIDTESIPEVRDWSGAKRGVFFRPVKQQLTLRLDADVIAWFKKRAPGAGAISRISIAHYARSWPSKRGGVRHEDLRKRHDAQRPG